MPISSKTFATIVSDQVAAIQAGAGALIDLTIGSVLRAVVEANAAVQLWLQGLILQLLTVTRAASSSGADLDSFMLDFGLVRLPAVAASGRVTFARFTSTAQAMIPVGINVQTADGSQGFIVIADTANPAYNAALNAYLIAAGVASASVSVVAITPGAAANVTAGQINTLTSALPNVDTASNAAAFTNGVDAESDTALRARFVAYIASLSKATKNAVGNAILSLQQGLSYSLTENFNYAGAAQPGYFFVVVDDGTGYPSGILLSSVYNAIDAVRALSTTFGVFAPVVITANIAMTVTTAAGYAHVATAALVATALQNYVNALPIDADLSFSRLTQIAYDASPGVTNVTGVTLNGATADLVTTKLQIIKAGTVSVA